MSGVIQITAALFALGVVLTLASETFATPVSRMVEAAFDAIEIRLEGGPTAGASPECARRRIHTADSSPPAPASRASR
jgi:hypothetical protein